MVSNFTDREPGQTHKDKSTASGPRGDRGQNGGKEDRDQEADSRDDGCQPSPATFGNSGTALNECSDRRAPKERADGYESSISAVCNSRSWEVTSLRVGLARKSRHRIEGCGAVDDVNIEEGEQCQRELRAVGSP